MTDEAVNNQEQIEKIRLDYAGGRITVEQAHELADPIIKTINDKALEIARKHGVPPRKITFNEVMR